MSTFDEWSQSTISKYVPSTVLAHAGFYNDKTRNVICCFRCGGIISGWQRGHKPLKLHRDNFPHCPFIQALHCKDKKSNVTEAAEQSTNMASSLLNMKSEADRLKTYTKWPKESYVSSAELAKCGLFYTGESDRTQCAFCQGILRNWNRRDNAFEEHKKHYKDCLFVQGKNCGNIAIKENKLNEFSSNSKCWSNGSIMIGNMVVIPPTKSENLEVSSIIEKSVSKEQDEVEEQEPV